MPNLRAQVVLSNRSGKPEDVVVNTFHFSSASVGDAAADVIRDHLAEFYNVGGVGPSGNAAGPIAAYISNTVSRSSFPVKVKVYNLDDPQPRFPIERTFVLGNAIGDATTLELPTEVALCASFFAGQNRPRTRGRLYIGPFHVLALEGDDLNERSRPKLALREGLVVALRRLMNKGANTQNLAVWGVADGVPIPAGPGAARVMRVATGGWVDDAWDTQRRRGQDAASRTPV